MRTNHRLISDLEDNDKHVNSIKVMGTNTNY